ncbi:DNA primase [Candidatus Nomurabacteria bacterium]|nr:DNA primase [Candidatus Nomurabacteria bacterium]
MSSSVDQIKSRIDIVSLVSSYMKLDKSGKSWKGKCPFHNEKTPSFFVSPERGSYYCFGCGASGDIFTFVEEFEGLDFKGALKLLADRAGVVLEVYSREKQEDKSEKEKLCEVMEEATNFFETNLESNIQAQEYLKSRGLTEKTIKDFRIGWAILDWRKLYDHLKSKNFTDKEIELAGLAKTPSALGTSPLLRGREGGGRMYDRFRGRIMFPISDPSGRIIAFSGRILADDPSTSSGQVVSQAKYLNSPETPIFNKSSVLFGIDKAKESIRKNNFSILVEGQMDLVLSHQAGYRNTVATSGTALSDSTVSKENVISNLGLVRRLSPNIVLAFDADKAGFNAANRAGRIALSLGMDVKVASLPEGVDPADLISKNGGDAWKEAIKNSKHIIEFILGKVIKDAGEDTRKAGRLIREKVLPYIDAIESSIERMHFLKKTADASGIGEQALKDDLEKVARDQRHERREIEEAKEFSRESRKEYILRKLLGIILWQKSLKDSIADPDKVMEKVNLILNASKQELLEKIKTSRGDLIFEAEVFYGEKKDNLEKDVSELLRNLEKEHLNEKLGLKMRELHHAEEMKDAAKSELIMKEIKEISARKEEINRI